MASPPNTVTPDRQTVLRLDLPEVGLGRARQNWQRSAQDMRRIKQVGDQVSSSVFLVASDAWILSPKFKEEAQTLKITYNAFVGPDEVNLANGLVSIDMFRKSDIPGMGTSASVIDSGAPAFMKHIQAGSSADEAQLFADADAFPPPADPIEQNIPLDRVLSGSVTYPKRAGFALKFALPLNWTGRDEFLRFYFGGPCETTPDTAHGGEFCLALRGGGDATLSERDPEAENPWPERRKFKWGAEHSGGIGNLAAISIIPYAWNRIAFLCPAAGLYQAENGFTVFGTLTTIAGAIIAAQAGGTQHLYMDLASTTGHAHLDAATGPGIIRTDRRRDDRTPFQILRATYPEEGTLIDAPFQLREVVPLGTRLTIKPNAFVPEGTTLTATLHDADTGNQLIAETGAFLSNSGQKKYFAVFHYTSDGEQTPALFGYAVEAEGEYAERGQEPLNALCVIRVNVTGADVTPDLENAQVDLKDVVDGFPILRIRDLIHSSITLTDGVGTVLTHLFEGMTVQAVAKLRGTPGRAYPSPTWHDYGVRMAGLWPKLERQFHQDAPFSFASSDTSPNPLANPNSTTGWAPWRITDIIRRLMNNSGVRDDELDIPDLPLRLWPSETMSPADFSIMPGVPYVRMVSTLARDFLGMILLRDPNAGSRGMWRLLQDPAPTSTNFLCTLYRDPPPGSGPRLAHHPGVYGSNATFIVKDTWNTYIKGAEGNKVTAYGMREGAPGDGARLLISDTIINQDSIDNPLSPHYLGEEVRIIRGVDPFLNTLQAVAWVARRIYERAAFSEKWFEATIPLLLVTDPQDSYQVRPRPLRINDLILIRVDGVNYPAIIRSCNPDYHHDALQFCSIEGKLLT